MSDHVFMYGPVRVRLHVRPDGVELAGLTFPDRMGGRIPHADEWVIPVADVKPGDRGMEWAAGLEQNVTTWRKRRAEAAKENT